MKISTLITVLTITLLTSFSSSLHAQEKSPAIQLIEVMEFSKTAKASASASFASFIEQLKTKGIPEAGIKEVTEASERFFSKTFDNPEIIAEMAKAYETSYTKEEIEQLLVFYKTPLGKKTLQAMPKIMQESEKIGTKYATQNQAGFQTEMEAIMTKYTPAP